MRDNGNKILPTVSFLRAAQLFPNKRYSSLGHGKLTYADGDQYIGEWKDGKKSGYGELLYTNGDKFSGHWLEDKASGMGRLDYQNGDYYEGQWELDRRHGWGKFFSNATGHQYEGYWKNSLKVSLMQGTASLLIINFFLT